MKICTNLGSLLGASLSLRERGGSHLLAGLGGLSLRKEDNQYCALQSNHVSFSEL